MKTFYLSNYNFSKEMENTLNEFFTKSFEKVIPLASLPLKKILWRLTYDPLIEDEKTFDEKIYVEKILKQLKESDEPYKEAEKVVSCILEYSRSKKRFFWIDMESSKLQLPISEVASAILMQRIDYMLSHKEREDIIACINNLKHDLSNKRFGGIRAIGFNLHEAKYLENRLSEDNLKALSNFIYEKYKKASKEEKTPIVGNYITPNTDTTVSSLDDVDHPLPSLIEQTHENEGKANNTLIEESIESKLSEINISQKSDSAKADFISTLAVLNTVLIDPTDIIKNKEIVLNYLNSVKSLFEAGFSEYEISKILENKEYVEKFLSFKVS